MRFFRTLASTFLNDDAVLVFLAVSIAIVGHRLKMIAGAGKKESGMRVENFGFSPDCN